MSPVDGATLDYKGKHWVWRAGRQFKPCSNCDIRRDRLRSLIVCDDCKNGLGFYKEVYREVRKAVAVSPVTVMSRYQAKDGTVYRLVVPSQKDNCRGCCFFKPHSLRQVVGGETACYAENVGVSTMCITRDGIWEPDIAVVNYMEKLKEWLHENDKA